MATRLGSSASDAAFIKLEGDESVPAIVGSERILRFQYMPEEISESKQSFWNDVKILGRSEPIRFYGSSGVRTIDLHLTFHVIDDAFFDVETNVNFLRSLVYPDYGSITGSDSANIPLPPPVVILKIGEWLSMRSIVTSVTVTRKGPWEKTTLNPNYAEVDVKFEEMSVTPPDANDVFTFFDMVDSTIQVSAEGVATSTNEAGLDSALLKAHEAVATTAEELLAVGSIASKFV